MKNNKGFAISLMLYAMILLIVTIFYLVLAIVKTRFTYSEKMVNTAIKFLDEHDENMSHGDRTGPLVVFNPPASGYYISGFIEVSIYDDNDGTGLDPSSIIIKRDGQVLYNSKTGYHATQVVQVLNNLNDSNKSYARFKVKMDGDYEHTLYVSAKDKKGNFTQTLPRYSENSGDELITYSYQKYYGSKGGPNCVIDGPKLVNTKDQDGKVVITGYTDVKDGEVTSESDLMYDITCTGENGIDAYLSRDDFKYTIDSSAANSGQENKNKHIYVNNITIINGINSVHVTIYAVGVYIPDSTNPVRCSEPLALELKNEYNIKDSSGMISNLDFDKHKVKVCFDATAGGASGGSSGGESSGGNPGTNPGTNPSGGITVTGATSCNKYYYRFSFACGSSPAIYNTNYGYTSESAASSAGNSALQSMKSSCSSTINASSVNVYQDWGYTASSSDGTVNTSQPHIATRNKAVSDCKSKLNNKTGTCTIKCG